MNKPDPTLPAPEYYPQAVLNRRTLLHRGALGFGGLACGSLAYAAGYEPYHPVLEQVTVPVSGLPAAFDGFRIVQLSDLHVQPGFPAAFLRPAIELGLAQRPDIFVLTGDYINDDAPDKDRYMHECAAAMASLDAPGGVFAIFGNHDYPEPPADPSPFPWLRAGIRTLNDESVAIKRGRDRIFLVGLRSFIKRPVTPANVLFRTPVEAVKIVLWHEPDRAHECAQQGVALQLSGHTHGGQVVLPFYGPPVLPAGGRKYASGLFDVNGMALYVSRGLGLLNPRVRFNCPPEVTVLTLRRV